MRLMLRYMAYAAGAVLIAAPMLARAQDSTGSGGPPQGGGHGRPGMGGGRLGDRQDDLLFRGITLTSVQRDSIAKLNAAQHSAMGQILNAHPDGGPPDSATRAQFQALRTQHRTDLRAVLTPDQQQTFDQNVAQMRSRMEQRMRGGGAEGGNP